MSPVSNNGYNECDQPALSCPAMRVAPMCVGLGNGEGERVLSSKI